MKTEDDKADFFPGWENDFFIGFHIRHGASYYNFKHGKTFKELLDADNKIVSELRSDIEIRFCNLEIYFDKIPDSRFEAKMVKFSK